MTLKLAILKALKALAKTTPAILSAILFIGLISAVIPKSFYAKLFIGNVIFDSFIGGLVGSVAAGNPVTSYIIGGEMLDQGVSLIAVTAFIVAWVTVGVVQLPAEAVILGKRFSFFRNLFAFASAIIVALITALTMVIL